MSSFDDGFDPDDVDADGDVSDAQRGIQSSIGPSGINPQALVGAMLCVLAVVLVGVVLTHTAFSSNDVPAAVTPTALIPARGVTSVKPVHHTTPVKKRPRVTPTTVPTPVTPTAPTVQNTTPATQPTVQIETVVTQPPAPTTPVTQPQQIVVPYTPPATSPPGIPVPLNPSPTPSG